MPDFITVPTPETAAEVGAAAGLSTFQVHDHLRRLERAGAVARTPGARGRGHLHEPDRFTFVPKPIGPVGAKAP